MNENYYSQKPKRSEFLWKRGGDGNIMLRMINSQYLISLGPLGTEIYERCDGKTPVSVIVEFLKNKHNHISPDHIEHDTYQFLHWLQSLGLLLIYWEDF
jgi:hypothetical protein